jgi:tripartite-type tricarboxylate transporter receptor subunit TctC
MEKLHSDLTRVLASRETEKRFETEGAEVVRMTPAEFGGFISAELAKWSRVAREVGIKAE